MQSWHRILGIVLSDSSQYKHLYCFLMFCDAFLRPALRFMSFFFFFLYCLTEADVTPFCSKSIANVKHWINCPLILTFFLAFEADWSSVALYGLEVMIAIFPHLHVFLWVGVACVCGDFRPLSRLTSQLPLFARRAQQRGSSSPAPMAAACCRPPRRLTPPRADTAAGVCLVSPAGPYRSNPAALAPIN